MKNKTHFILTGITLFGCVFLLWKSFQDQGRIQELEDELYYHENSNESLTNGEVYMIGNSITSSGNWAELLGNRNVINKGISGITTLDAVMMADKIVPERPDKVFIMLGINDIKVEAPWDSALSNYLNFLYAIKLYSPRTEINIISVLPTNYQDFRKYEVSLAEIKLLNEALEELCVKHQWNYVNCYDDFLNDNDELIQELSTDGLHLNQKGYNKLAAFIKPLL